MRSVALIIALVLLATAHVVSQPDSTNTSEPPTIDPVKLGVVGGVKGAGFVVGNELVNEFWW